MNFDIFGLIVLVLALIVAAAIQLGAALGIMFLLYKYAGAKLDDTSYGTFDFDNFQMPAFTEVVLRLALLIAPAMILLHVLAYLFVPLSVKFHGFLWAMIFLILQSTLLAAGLWKFFALDKIRLIAITAGCGLFYLILYGIFLHGKLY